MNVKRTSWLLGGAAVLVMLGPSMVSGMAGQSEHGSPAAHSIAGSPARILVAQAEGAPVSYTAEQADRGKEEFGKECIECHGKDLRGGLLGGPPLRGQSFEDKYGNGSPAGVLFEVMSTTMPPNAPGSYSPSVYADLMAYILKTNGYRAGAELPSDVEALYNLVMEK